MTALAERDVVASVPTGLWIGGEWRETDGSPAVEDPSTGEVLAEIADATAAFRVVERLQTGMVGLNQGIVSNAAAPFGGVKASGVGREGIEEYLDLEYVAMAS
jgi:acyl-CoA reductase-like NAD-dependent aldehyde dehydrogenase